MLDLLGSCGSFWCSITRCHSAFHRHDSAAGRWQRHRALHPPHYHHHHYQTPGLSLGRACLAYHPAYLISCLEPVAYCTTLRPCCTTALSPGSLRPCCTTACRRYLNWGCGTRC